MSEPLQKLPLNNLVTTVRITQPPKHHWFGFHDLVATNAANDRVLALESDSIARPPLPGDTASNGYIDLGTGTYVPICRTRTFNYPQGARQQWLGNSDRFLCNDRETDGRLVCRVCDARTARVVNTLPFPVHCAAYRAKLGFFVDYDRLHWVGGYGYVGGQPVSLKDIPDDDGIMVGDLHAATARLLVPLSAIAAHGEMRARCTGYPHYVTHLLLNPSQTRLAFLHRYRVPDGGEITRLMTIGIDGSDIRCLAKGFLSHFDWLDDTRLIIWGREESGLCAFRESPYLRMPGVLQLSRAAKQVMRSVRRHRGVSGKTPLAQSKSFLIVHDQEGGEHIPIAIGALTEDGHPMVNPLNRRWVSNDTYPDPLGVRTLMLFDIRTGSRTDLGRYAMMQERPDASSFDVKACLAGLAACIRRRFPEELYLFTRSGYHCDLHPRWSSNGRSIFFDSIHEGTRQIYQARLDDNLLSGT